MDQILSLLEENEGNMVLKNIVKVNNYQDSVFLMSLANRAGKLPEVCEVSVMMGTPQNKELLQRADLLTPEGQGARPDDLLIALRAESEADAQKALNQIQQWLAQRQVPRPVGEVSPPRTLGSALERMPEANLVLISLPGQYVRWEAQKALEKGRHVMIFSDNVSIENEVALKAQASRKGLLIMGPDCGTAILWGKSLGFGNVIRRGTIGLAGASGTGIQEVSSLLDRQGLGISQAIGVGSRDLTKEVRGTSTLQAVQALEADSGTDLIVYISKPPHEEVSTQILKALAKGHKPCVVCFLGHKEWSWPSQRLFFSPTLEAAALHAVALSQGTSSTTITFAAETDLVLSRARGEWSRLGKGQRYVRGLFSGGSLCAEAGGILAKLLPELHTNFHLLGASHLEEATHSLGHSLVDLGADEFTVGVPHPMIDFTVRNQRLIQEARDPKTAVVLLDIVLGYGAHSDPAGAILPALLEGKKLAEDRGGHLCCVAAICGTVGDPQNLEKQQERLEQNGVVVMPTAAQAARFAAMVAKRGQDFDKVWIALKLPDISPVAKGSVKDERPPILGDLLEAPPRVINLGLSSFAQSLEQQDCQVLHVDWRPPAGGDPRLLEVLGKLR
jgi:FdrA protein